jgi:hypothetical protein
MASRQTLLIDGTDIITLGAKLLDYTVLNFSSFKDGGFKNPDGIDGVLDSPSTAMSGTTGSITIIFEGTNERQVNANYRKFKQFIRSKSFWKISTKEDPDFYRIGKFLGESEPGILTDYTIMQEAWYATKISIQFKDGYEYSSQVPELSYTFDSTKNGMEITNSGRPTRHLTISLKATAPIIGYFKVEIIGQGYLEFGSQGQYLSQNDTVRLDFSTFELLKIASTNQVTNIFKLIKSGKFFKVPSGKSTLRISYKATETGQWTTTLPATAKFQLTTSYY